MLPGAIERVFANHLFGPERRALLAASLDDVDAPSRGTDLNRQEEPSTTRLGAADVGYRIAGSQQRLCGRAVDSCKTRHDRNVATWVLRAHSAGKYGHRALEYG